MIMLMAVAKMTETFAEGREKGEAQIKEILEKYIVGSSNVSDDSSFGVLFFEGTQAPDSSSLESSAAKFGSSEENFKNVAMSIKEDLIKASEIITSAASKAEENTEKDNENKETESEPVPEKTEPQPSADPVDAAVKVGSFNYPALIFGVACIIELIIIVLLLVF